MNQQLGEYIALKQKANELNTNVVDREWVADLPQLVKDINEVHSHPVKKFDDEPRCKGQSCELLDEGLRVRVIAEKPSAQYENGKKTLPGGFRKGDERWEREIRTITQVVLRPSQPPMYRVSGIDNVAYTRGQLQLVNAGEVVPQTKKFVIHELTKRERRDGMIKFLVKWKGHAEMTWEPRKSLLEQVPKLVREFEKK